MAWFVFRKKIISRCNITLNIAKKRVFGTFRLGYLKNVT